MMTKDVILFLVFMAVLLLSSIPVGRYMAKVFTLQPLPGDKILNPL